LVQAFLKKWWVESDFKAPNFWLFYNLMFNIDYSIGFVYYWIECVIIHSSSLIHSHCSVLTCCFCYRWYVCSQQSERVCKNIVITRFIKFWLPISKLFHIMFYFPRFVRRVWRYQRGNQNPYIEEEQATQWLKGKVQRDKQRYTKHKTKDRVTYIIYQ
jgi:hypothetical protein